MDDALTLESVLDRGLDALLNPAGARRRAAVQLPDLVVHCLLGRPEPEVRQDLASRLATDLWPALQAARGESWDFGWTELTAAVLLAIELLHGELPRALSTQFKGTPAEQAWQSARGRFQRFVLLIDSSVHVARAFATVRTRPPDVRVESAVGWMIDGPPFRDRSHTLMLALLADGALPEDAGPVAATGVLLDDGDRIGPVGGLVEKVAAWQDRHADGLLITAPPDELSPETWVALIGRSNRWSDKREPKRLVGATMREIKAKLGASSTAIASWDGTPLAEAALLEPRLAARGVDPPDSPFRDALLDAAWAAFREARCGGSRRGVLVHGAPGAGEECLLQGARASLRAVRARRVRPRCPPKRT